MSAGRWAVYFAPPPRHALWLAGARWLGRDAVRVEAGAVPAREGVAEPFRYGLHATLKPPMALADGCSEADFLAAVARCAAACQPFDMPALQVDVLNGFLALLPVSPVPPAHPLRCLADACVTGLDGMRRPPSEDELQRRIAAARSDSERAHARRWGYPFVLDDWRFHMTLSDTGFGPALRPEAERHFAHALAQPLRCDALAVFHEAAPGLPFVWTHTFALGEA